MANPKLDQRQFDENGEYLHGQALLDFVRAEQGDTLLLSFSCGKDSVATWLYLRDQFNLIPYFMYLIPGLEFVERNLQYYEQFFAQRILRLPHPEFYRMLNAMQWQTPETTATLWTLDLPHYDYADLDNEIAREHGLAEPFTAMGIRKADNLMRYRLINQMGVVGLGKRRRFFYPIWDWNVNQVGEIFTRHGCKLASDYAMYGRTVVALNYRRLVEIKRAYPGDYTKILEWFPLAELEIFRYEQIPAQN